ncbi:hypothetical protein PIB30_004765 [Stylosanthes scabra]|uniref:glutathione transferase n=1 Tax=Stylosanthes scabra TaxID=79078 RepID=A0ABU6T408_9FABA|nr:hypothetical protein [Stylosanthes scabra]
MSKANNVILFGFGVSPFCGRVKVALAEKGVSYEEREEDLCGGKSEQLLKYNPIYQKVPVLLHDGKPVLESSIIVTYIDEVWPSNPLLPNCAYERAKARFWTDYIDKKVFDTARGIWLSKGGEEQEVAKKDFIEILKQLEEALGEKDFFGGDSFGYVDVIAIPLTTWFSACEKFGGFKVEDHCPKISAWTKRCFQRPTVVKSLPDPENVYQFTIQFRKMHGL